MYVLCRKIGDLVLYAAGFQSSIDGEKVVLAFGSKCYAMRFMDEKAAEKIRKRFADRKTYVEVFEG